MVPEITAVVAMVGRKQVPEQIKLIRGTFRDDRVNKNAPDVSENIPKAPAYLSDRARAIFKGLSKKIEGMGYASDSHSEMLALCAVRLEEIEKYTKTLGTEGDTYKTTNQTGGEVIKPRPEVAMRSEAMRHAQSILVEFGLSPASKNKVSTEKKKEENPFANIGSRKTG